MAVPPDAAAAVAQAPINWTFEVIRILLTSAVAVAGSGILIGLWQLKERYIDDRTAELIKEVDSIGDVATDYWSRSKPQKARKFREILVHDQTRDRALEADLVARMARIGRMRASVGEYLDSKKMKALFDEEGELNSACTGGDFGSVDRVCESERFSMIRGTAARYIGLIRDARQARLGLPWFRRILG